ncbi:MAG: YjbF family lipoprotein [Gemmobacter sp.]|nr:YjbF family lipoprotein [Gemmobacter sp.]
MIRTTRAVLALAAIALLTGCGNDKTRSTSLVGGVAAVSKALVAGRQAAGTAQPITRQDLAALNSPVIKGELQAANSTIYLVPISRNGAVETWATSDDLTVSFRDGVMTATRGFGPDIMQAVVPTRAQLASGQGSHGRSYFYLDGADQMRRFDYRCSMSNLGSETITVVGQQHSTRHVEETCEGKAVRFTNEYWFEGDNFIRKSKELTIPEWGYLELARVIDKG